MSAFKPVVKVISDPIAPVRLRGRSVTITLDPVSRKLNFQIDMPDEATTQEVAYLRLRVGEMVDDLREQFPGLIGDKAYEGPAA